MGPWKLIQKASFAEAPAEKTSCKRNPEFSFSFQRAPPTSQNLKRRENRILGDGYKILKE